MVVWDRQSLDYNQVFLPSRPNMSQTNTGRRSLVVTPLPCSFGGRRCVGQEQGMRGTAAIAVCSGQQPSQDRDVTGIKSRDVSSPCPATAQCGQTEEVCGQRAHLALPRQCVTNGATGRHTLSPQAHTCVHGLQPLPLLLFHVYESFLFISLHSFHANLPQPLTPVSVPRKGS